MPGNSKAKGDARKAAAAARRAAIAQQYNIPPSAMATSKPNQLGRGAFLSKAEADKHFTSMKYVKDKIDFDRKKENSK